MSFAAAASAPLGIIGKCSSTKHKAARVERYQALSQARYWLRSLTVENKAKAFGKDVHLTTTCRYTPIGSFVSVHHDRKHDAAFFGSVATCGSVWSCPLCAAKIQSRRREELAQLVEWAYSKGYQVSMVTFTFPHTKFDNLNTLTLRQADSFRRLRSGRAWQDFRSNYGLVGFVRSLEVTYGKNGWHPHTHELWITKNLTPLNRGDFYQYIVNRWKRSCVSSGLLDLTNEAQVHGFLNHSVDCSFDVSSSDYLVKQDASRNWGVDAEMTGSLAKKSDGSVHPHEFLIRGDSGDRERFIHYSVAMKGKRQIFWSRGLKKLVNLEEKDDDQLALESLEDADLLGLLTKSQWSVVRGNDARAELLTVAELEGWLGVVKFLKTLGFEP
ncbi:MAG: replicase [Inoviridae sp.]|nr:MAG: replicase [Inoviridae sp.]